MRRTHPVRRLATLAVPLVALLGATACIPPYEGPADARSAIVVGDSIVFQAGYSGDLRDTFVGRGWQIAVQADIAVTTSDDLVNILEAGTRNPTAVVLDHSTTDVNSVIFSAPQNQAARRAEVDQSIRTALDLLGTAGCVVLVTAQEPPSRPEFNAEAKRHNAMLVAAAQSRPNTTWLDWAAWSSGHPEWFGDDSVHLTDAGKTALADIMESTAASCGRW